jgi:hypothetical protein
MDDTILYNLNRLLVLLENNFTEKEINEVKYFLNYDEYGIALETLCAIIQDENKKISSEIFNLVNSLSKDMGIDQCNVSNLVEK